MINEKDNKVNRVLNIYEKLMLGGVINKKEIANTFGVSEKSVQRDIEDIRLYFYERAGVNQGLDIEYSRGKRGYYLTQKSSQTLRQEDALVITKILLESRALNKEELTHLINVVLNQVGIDQRKHIKELIENELFNFVPIQHRQDILDKLWDLSNIIKSRQILRITYIKVNQIEVTREIAPVSIVFSEYYFYLIGYFRDAGYDEPIVFRVDRIKHYKLTPERFYIPENNRFEDGEFRKRIQFMYLGKLIKIRFEFYGISREAVLDRLPTARIMEQDKEKCIFEAEVYGKGIMMWILSQGKNIRVISPESFVKDISKEIHELRKLYIVAEENGTNE